MAVYIEKTDNPNIIKFINDELLTQGSFEFSTSEEAAVISPLSLQLLSFPMVERVYITANIIALQKMETVGWEAALTELKDLINQAIDEKKVITKKNEPSAISIYAEMTPNPEVLKFVANKMLFDGMLEFKNKEEAAVSPLATALFQFPFVKELFITENYIAITKNNTVQWEEITLQMREEISRLLKEEIPTLKTEDSLDHFKESTANSHKKYTSDETAIKSLLDEYVKPAVVADGGNIELIEYQPETKTVQLLLQGACSGCPSSTVTLKNGIETMLKQFLPEKIEKVEAING